MESSRYAYRFRSEHRLRGCGEFRRVFSQGKKISGTFFTLHILPEAKEKKIGFSISRKIGNAIVRNLIKRRLRELFRLNQQDLMPSSQVISAKKGAGGVSWIEMTREILELWSRAKIGKKESEITLPGPGKPGKRDLPESVLLRWIFSIYKKMVSPVLRAMFGNGCRFYPSCSSYAREAMIKHGIFKGIYFTILRVLKCNPWHPGGLDPVPGSKEK